MLLENSSPDVTRCTLSHNAVGAGIYVRGGGRPRVAASVVSFGSGSGIYAEGVTSHPSIVCCDVYGNEDRDYGGSLHDQTGLQGNISQDPLFCDPEHLGFSVGDGSPCLPNRNLCVTLIGAHGAGCHTLTVIRVTPEGTGDAATISEAMEAAVAGDTIMLAPGVFTGPGNRDILSRGFPIVITSEAGAGETVIDCGEGGDAYYGFYFGGGEDTSTVLEGVTITGAGKGAIAFSNGSDPLVRDCRLTGNHAHGGLARRRDHRRGRIGPCHQAMRHLRQYGQSERRRDILQDINACHRGLRDHRQHGDRFGRRTGIVQLIPSGIEAVPDLG